MKQIASLKKYIKLPIKVRTLLAYTLTSLGFYYSGESAKPISVLDIYKTFLELFIYIEIHLLIYWSCTKTCLGLVWIGRNKFCEKSWLDCPMDDADSFSSGS